MYSPARRVDGGGGRHIDNECMRSQGRIRKAGGGGVQSASVRYEKWGGGGCSLLQSDTKSGGGGGGCLPYDDLYLGLCAPA